jgi:hypothetical protein
MTLGEFSMVISVAGALPYIAHILWGRVRPERATWFVWSLILALAIWGYRASGANDSVWFLVGDLAVTAMIFLLSLWRGQGGFSRLDLVCVGIASLSLGLWQLSSISLFAVWGVLIADSVAMLPTLIKSLHDPRSESSTTYAFSSVAALCGFVAVGQWNFSLLFYPAYLFLANFVLALTIWVGTYQVSRWQATKGNLHGKDIAYN